MTKQKTRSWAAFDDRGVPIDFLEVLIQDLALVTDMLMDMPMGDPDRSELEHRMREYAQIAWAVSVLRYHELRAM